MKYSEEEVGKIIRSERKKLGMSQDLMGKAVGIVGKQISNYENGKLFPPMDILLDLCDVFECELGYLLGEEDYSEGTKLQTAITERTGLSAESTDILHKITGTEKSCLNFGYESERYCSLLNRIILSPNFLSLVESIYALDEKTQECKDVWHVLESQMGRDKLNEALQLYHTSSIYIQDHDTPQLSQEQQRYYKEIDSTIEQHRNLSYDIKVLKYELHKSFELFIEALFPGIHE